jgi:PAS domain S-box-containing protein
LAIRSAMKTTTLTSRELWLASVSVVFVVLLVVTISYRSAVVFRESAESAQHSREVLEALYNVRLDVGNIESSYRGFILTGDDTYLDSYRASIPSVTRDEASVRDLTLDNRVQQRQLPALEGLTLLAIQLADAEVDLRRTKGFEAAANAARTGPDTRIVEEARGVIREMQSEETRLLVLRNADTERRSRQNNAVLILGTVLGVFIVAFVGWRVQHENFKRGIAEKALQDSQEQYRMLLDGVQEYAIFMLDAQGRIVTWNAGADRMYGYGGEDIAGQNFARFFPAKDIERGRLDRILQMAEVTGRHEERGIRVRKDGAQFMANAIFTALRDAAGNLRGFSVISHDLSESKESAAKYRGLLEAAPDAMVVVNQGGEIVLVNVHAEKQFGYRRDELLGQQVQNIIPEGFAERLLVDGRRSTADALAQRIGTGIELSGRRKDGTEFPIEIMLSPLESAEGILVTAAIRDIGVRRATEQHLAQMEARYRGLLEAAPDAMVVVNRAGEIVLLNVQAEKQFGYPRDELLGQQVENIIPEGFAERLLADGRRSTAEALAQRIGTGIELSGRRKDGIEFPIEIMLSPLDSAEGTLVTAAIRDITDRRLIERQLAQAQKMEALGNLTGGMAHDFNNGLGVIIGNLDLLGRLLKADGNALQLCNEAHDGAVRCADLIQRLLAFARQQPLSPKRTDVNALVDSIAVLLGRTLGEDITLTLSLCTELSPVVVDPAQLEAALTNLANNARDAMPRGGRLTIATKAVEFDEQYAATRPDVLPGAYVMIEVSDTGTGIAPDVVGRIFEPFFTTKPPGAGSGLGLSMAFGFARQSGGHLAVYSEPGHGSTFRIYLPYAYVGNMQAAAPADQRPVLGGDETVLLVEDNPQLRQIAKRQLTQLGYRVRDAEHAAAALVILSSKAQVDLLFTDVVMPGTLDGLELAQQARRMRPGIKVLLASGFPRVRTGDHRMANNPFPLLTKPYPRDELARMVREVLDRLDEQPSIVAARPIAGVPERMHDRDRMVATATG